MFGNNNLDKFKISLAANADSAYQVEACAFENFGGPKNLINKKPPTPP